ncbi:MAG: hypothetical protein IH991_19015, partial [Planctomycetes bacterium]|nr:hypothetical protein [Planctomycetota bacterium]
MNRPRKTALDYAIVALSPALIMAMVCSLVWFLLEVFYQGNYGGRLQFIMFALVFAAVLVSRISIEAGRERAFLYGVAVALIAWLAIGRFVEIRGPLAGISWMINILLLAIAGWSISRLTWDCTHLDDSQDTSGQGLMQAMGLDGPKFKNESR